MYTPSPHPGGVNVSYTNPRSSLCMHPVNILEGCKSATQTPGPVCVHIQSTSWRGASQLHKPQVRSMFTSSPHPGGVNVSYTNPRSAQCSHPVHILKGWMSATQTPGPLNVHIQSTSWRGECQLHKPQVRSMFTSSPHPSTLTLILFLKEWEVSAVWSGGTIIIATTTKINVIIIIINIIPWPFSLLHQLCGLVALSSLPPPLQSMSSSSSSSASSPGPSFSLIETEEHQPWVWWHHHHHHHQSDFISLCLKVRSSSCVIRWHHHHHYHQHYHHHLEHYHHLLFVLVKLTFFLFDWVFSGDGVSRSEGTMSSSSGSMSYCLPPFPTKHSIARWPETFPPTPISVKNIFINLT